MEPQKQNFLISSLALQFVSMNILHFYEFSFKYDIIDSVACQMLCVCENWGDFRFMFVHWDAKNKK